MAEIQNKISKIQRVDGKKQIVFGVVYSPMDLDTWGEAMTAEDIELMAYRFMELNGSETIDEMHDEAPKQDCWPVESFIARKGDPDGYPEGSWVLGVKIDNSDVWEKIESGKLNGFSFQALVSKVATVVEIEYEPERIGVTEISSTDSIPEHTHLYYATINEDGVVVGGLTSTIHGHSHKIERASATTESNGHSHRYFL